jgi:ABC-type amino acid transport substrate-binding protein
MKKSLCRALVLAFFAAGSAAAADLDAIRKTGVLRAIVATAEQKARFDPAPGAARPGFERELLENFARLQKLRLEPVVVPHYNDRLPALEQGKGDLIVGIIATAERRERILFSEEVFPAHIVAVTLAPHRVIEQPAQLAAEKVGVLAGTTTWKQAAVQAGVAEASMKSYPTIDAVFAALAAGEITATPLSLADFGLSVQKHPKLQAGAVLGEPGSACWGVPKDAVALKAALDEYLTASRRSQAWNRLVVSYFGEQILKALGKQR